MRLTSAFLTLLPFTSIFVLAAPASGLTTSKSSLGQKEWSVAAKWQSNARRNGPLALHHALSKHHHSIPLSLQQACDRQLPHAKRKGKRQNGSAPAVYLESDKQFVVPVKIGDSSNPQTLNLDFDTGSADLWVYSDRLPISQQSGHNIFKSSESKSFTLDPTLEWKITYGDQSTASGSIGFDTVSVGESTVENQAIQIAEQLSSHFREDKGSDGLLGLAFGHINTITPTQQKTFFENAMDSLDARIFTVDLRHEDDGSYNFGFLDFTKYTGEINYVPVDSTNGFWEFESNLFSLDGGITTNRAPATAIADTGTSLLLVSETVAEAYYDTFPESALDTIRGGYTFPCSSTPPPFTVHIGEYPVTIPSHLLKYAPIEEGSATCFGGLQAIPEGKVGGAGSSTTYVFGEVFLKACFAVFDYGTDGSDPRFGFGLKANAQDPNIGIDNAKVGGVVNGGEEGNIEFHESCGNGWPSDDWDWNEWPWALTWEWVAFRERKWGTTCRGPEDGSGQLYDDQKRGGGRYVPPVHDEFKRGL